TEALEPLAAAVLRGLDLVATRLTSVPVRLALSAKQGTPIVDVKRAWSHPAALRQCTQRLAAMGIEPVVCYDTAGAAKIIAADAARLQALAPARDVQVVSLGQPAPHASRLPPKEGTAPAVKSLPHATARRAATLVEVGPFKVGGGHRAMIAGPCSVESPEQV